MAVISKIGKKLHFRQRVIATATVFFRRFYLKNSICDSDPYLVLVACCYVAGKAEELPAHIKSVIAVANPIFCSISHLFLALAI
jgi:cyclin-C